MLIRDLARLASSQLTRNFRKSLLVIIGFMVGVASLIAMDTLGRATMFFLTSFMEDLGQANIIRVRQMGLKGGFYPGRGFSLDLVDDVRRELPRRGQVSAMVTDYSSELRNGKNILQGRLSGVQKPFFGIYGLQLAHGRSFLPDDMRSVATVAIIGSEVARALFGGREAVGSPCLAGTNPFVVVGVLEPSIFENFNHSIFVPVTSALRRVPDCRKLDTIFIRAENLDDVEDVARWVDRSISFREASTMGRLEVRVNREALKRIKDSILILKVFVMMVSGVTFFLGGTGIMNVFLASINERSTEIGLRKAVGARDSDIALQILTEVGLVCAISSGLGMACGLMVVRAVVWYTGHPELGDVSLVNALGFVVFAVLIGVSFSLSPALKASRKDAVEAIRGM